MKQISPPALEIALGSSSESEDFSEYQFGFQLIDPYITAVQEAREWEQDAQLPRKSYEIFPNLKKARSFFSLSGRNL